MVTVARMTLGGGARPRAHYSLSTPTVPVFATVQAYSGEMKKVYDLHIHQ